MKLEKGVSTFIFIPETLRLYNEVGFLEGFSTNIDGKLVFYILKDKVVPKTSQLIGYCSSKTPDCISPHKNNVEWLYINNETESITINGPEEYNVTCIFYDLDQLKKCDPLIFKTQDNGEIFDTLLDTVQCTQERDDWKYPHIYVFQVIISLILKCFSKIDQFLCYSSIVQHLLHNLILLQWIFRSLKTGRSLKVKNVIVSKILDGIFGFLFLYIFFKYEDTILRYMNDTFEVVIVNLKHLLNVLMGSPIGLKLNQAFNVKLAKFFFYHISLWRTFVRFIQPLLHSNCYLLLTPALLGLSFQVAIFEDLLKFCTVHVYCIYVYAARLYGIQVYSLVALWRLFIGRKCNPLRDRIDSYQYNEHQLFIGILIFTILLFLLPTTLLYYVVFTLFRIVLMLLQSILTYGRIFSQYLPLYISLLWITSSPSVTGVIDLRIHMKKTGERTTLIANIKRLPIITCFAAGLPDITFQLPRMRWGQFLRSTFTGNQLL